MIVYPLMDLLGGHVVKLDPNKHKEPEKIYGPVGLIADRWLKAGAFWLHVVDLNAALGVGTPNHLSLLSLLPRLARSGAKLQWGGGIRDASTLRMLLEAEFGDKSAAIDRVVVGTRAIKDWAWLQGAAESYPGRIVVAIDAAGRDIVVGGWQEKAGIDVVDFVQQAKDVPIAGFLYTNVEVEGKGLGVDWAPVEALIQSSPKPVTFAGGIATVEDILRFRSLKAHGVVIGSALYSGAIDFARAASVGA